MKKRHTLSIKKKTNQARRKVCSILSNIIRTPLSYYKRLSLYSRCDEIPLSNFIDCLCDNNLNRLKKNKYFPVINRWKQEAWSILGEEYSQKTDGDKYKATINITKDIYRDVCRLLAIDTCINRLVNKYDKDAADILRNFGYKLSFNADDREKYLNELAIVKKKVKIIVLSLEKNREKYEKLSDKKAITGNERDEFINTLTILSKHQGYRINPDVTTLLEYLNILDNYKKETERLIRNYGNRKNK